MGGRGGRSGLASEHKNVIQFPQSKSETKQTKLWDYRGYTQAVDKIEEAYNNANTEAKRMKVYRAINLQDRNIGAELNRIESGVDGAGDKTVIMKERRRLRQIQSKLLKG
jgi:hypothetical protein